VPARFLWAHACVLNLRKTADAAGLANYHLIELTNLSLYGSPQLAT